MWTELWQQAASKFRQEKNERYGVRGSRRHSDPPRRLPTCMFLADTIPAASYVELVASHLSYIEDSDSFTAEVRGFLADGGGF